MKFIWSFVIVISSNTACAVQPVLSMRFGNGGTPWSDITGGQNYSINAGGGLELDGGVILPISPTEPHRFELQLTGGLIYNDQDSNDGNQVTWQRFPIEAIYYYRNTQENFRIGWGSFYQIHNRLYGDRLNSAASAVVNDALGWTVAAELVTTKIGTNKSLNNSLPFASASMGLKYNSVIYQMSNFTGNPNGNCLFLTYTLFWN